MKDKIKLEEIIIYGTGGFARELHQLVNDVAVSGNAVACVGFLVDREHQQQSTVHGLPVLGDVNWLASHPGKIVAVGIGDGDVRRRIIGQIQAMTRSRFMVLQHPRAWIGGNVEIGVGSIICAGALITSDISIGSHVQVHVGCKIGHDTIIGDFVTVAPGAILSGRVEIGQGTFIGTGAIILPKVKIGSSVMIGAGAVVTKDVPDRVKVAGVPARIIGQNA